MDKRVDAKKYVLILRNDPLDMFDCGLQKIRLQSTYWRAHCLYSKFWVYGVKEKRSRIPS